MFDNPQDFLNQTYDEPNSTKLILPPEDEYNATIHSLNDPNIFTYKRGPNIGKPGMMLNVNWLIDDRDGKVEAVTNRASNVVRLGVSLDCKWDAAGNFAGLDMRPGVNLQLGRLREAVNLNGPGFSFGKFIGKAATIQVKHKADEREGHEGEFQAEVSGVTSLGSTFKKEKK